MKRKINLPSKKLNKITNRGKERIEREREREKLEACYNNA